MTRTVANEIQIFSQQGIQINQYPRLDIKGQDD